MYNKDLKEDIRVRLSIQDMEFLIHLSNKRGLSISKCVRDIISEYRRNEVNFNEYK